MAYATLSEVKTYLGITGTDQDDRINLLLDMKQAMLDDILGDLTEGTKTDTLRYCDLRRNRNGVEFTLRIPNVSSVDSIAGNPVTSVLGDTYEILPGFNNNVVWMYDIAQYTGTIEYDYFKVEYTAGYNPIPFDLKEALIQLVQIELTKDQGKQVSSYRLGPRQVSYSTDQQGVMDNISTTIKRYQNPTI